MRVDLNKVFKYILTMLFIIFLGIYFFQNNGYVEYQNKNKVKLTQNQIKKFEKDVAQGKNVSINKYLKNTNKNYQNNLSRLGNKTSKSISTAVSTVISKSLKILIKISQ